MHTMNDVRIYDFPHRGDERGNLIIAEGGSDVPFEIKRVFYICGTDRNMVRGRHANRQTEFMLINVAGTSKIKIRDGEGNEAIYILNRPDIGIYIPNMIWKEMYDFSEDSVLLVLCSTHYDADEYIRDYDQYEEEVQRILGRSGIND